MHDLVTNYFNNETKSNLHECNRISDHFQHPYLPEPELSGTRRLPGLRIGERPSGMVSCDIRALASNKQRRTNSGVTRGCGGPVSGPAGFTKYHIKPNDSYLTWRV